MISPVKVLNNMIHPKSLRNFSGHFSMACRQKMVTSAIIVNSITYTSLENTKSDHFLTTSHRKVAREILSSTLDISYGLQADAPEGACHDNVKSLGKKYHSTVRLSFTNI